MQYGNVNVDESRILEPNLFFDNVLLPDVTYNDQYQGDAASGLVKVYRQGLDGTPDPETPAGDFIDTQTNNDLIDLRLNNAFRRSKKIYRIAANGVPYQLADETLSTAVAEIRQGWQASGIACLAHEGTVFNDTTAIAKNNIKKMLIDIRKAARKGKAIPKIVFASVDTFSTMLEAAGEHYTPVTNDKMISTGQVGDWLGMRWYEVNATENSTAKYYDHAGTLQTVDLTLIDLVMYDPSAFSIVNNLEEIRIVDSENFVGSKAQVEINTGYRVTNSAKIIVKMKAGAQSA